MEALTGVLWALTPTVCVGLVFWFVMRSIIRADRSERAEYAKIEREEREKLERLRASAVDDEPDPGQDSMRR